MSFEDKVVQELLKDNADILRKIYDLGYDRGHTSGYNQGVIDTLNAYKENLRFNADRDRAKENA